jgi:uncharacterized protein (TIRG00374 family)
MSRVKWAPVLKLAQYLVGLAALGWVLMRVDWDTVSALLADVSAPVLVGIALASVAAQFLRFFSLNVLLNDVRPTRFRQAARIELVINFVNQLLPSRVSGRSVSPLVVRYHTGASWGDAVGVIGIYTGLYAILYGTVSLVGFALAFQRLRLGIGLIVLTSVGLYLVLGGIILRTGARLEAAGGAIARAESAIARVPRVGGQLADLTDRAPEITESSASRFSGVLANQPLLLLYSVTWLGALAITPGARIYLLFEAFGTSFEPVLLLPVYLLMAYSVTLLPLTPGGVGITEATATVVFVALGVPAAVAAPAVLIDRFLGAYLPALIGWYPAVQMDLDDIRVE